MSEITPPKIINGILVGSGILVSSVVGFSILDRQRDMIPPPFPAPTSQTDGGHFLLTDAPVFRENRTFSLQDGFYEDPTSYWWQDARASRIETQNTSYFIVRGASSADFFAALETYRAARDIRPKPYLAVLPEDIATISFTQRKRLFQEVVASHISLINSRIRADRERLKALEARIARGEQLAIQDEEWRRALYAKHGVAPGKTDDLLVRFDEVPLSLALAQSIIETGWGTSRSARQDNALFGQMTAKDGEQIVKPFVDLFESSEAYVFNINRHPAYADMRKIRAALRSRNQPLSGFSLAETMLAYSELGSVYTERLQEIIVGFQLEKRDYASE